MYVVWSTEHPPWWMHGPLIYTEYIQSTPFTTLEYTKVGLRPNPDVQVETHQFYQRTISFSILGCSLVEKSVLLYDRIQAFTGTSMDTTTYTVSMLCGWLILGLGWTLNRVHTIPVTENIHPRTPYLGTLKSVFVGNCT